MKLTKMLMRKIDDLNETWILKNSVNESLATIFWPNSLLNLELTINNEKLIICKKNNNKEIELINEPSWFCDLNIKDKIIYCNDLRSLIIIV